MNAPAGNRARVTSMATMYITLLNVHVFKVTASARLAQSAERKALNIVVVGSSPTVGELFPDSTSNILD